MKTLNSKLILLLVVIMHISKPSNTNTNTHKDSFLFVEQPKSTKIEKGITNKNDDVKPQPNVKSTCVKKNKVKSKRKLANIEKLSRSQKAYLKEITKIAKSEEKKYGIPAPVKIAQAIHETNWGTSDIAMKCNNHFGIKYKSDFPESQKKFLNGSEVLKTFEFIKDGKGVKRKNINDKFCSYDSRWNSFRHHSEFLKYRMNTNDKYKCLKNIKVGDWKTFAINLGRTPYSTDREYSKKLIKIIKTYKLYNI